MKPIKTIVASIKNEAVEVFMWRYLLAANDKQSTPPVEPPPINVKPQPTPTNTPPNIPLRSCDTSLVDDNESQGKTSIKVENRYSKGGKTIVEIKVFIAKRNPSVRNPKKNKTQVNIVMQRLTSICPWVNSSNIMEIPEVPPVIRLCSNKKTLVPKAKIIFPIKIQIKSLNFLDKDSLFNEIFAS